MVELDSYMISAFENNDVERRFVSDCNEVIHFKFVRCQKDIESSISFKPEMSHQIFGKPEKIFGYNDLNIKLYYTAGWLRTYINVSYKERIDPSVIGLPADNVMEILSKFLDHDYFENIDFFVNTIKEEPAFKPYGNLINSVTINDKISSKVYEIYHLHLSNTNMKHFKNYYQRLQRFLIWYIDGASYVDIEDDRWNYFIMYEKYLNESNEKAYAVVAFGTVYEYYAYPDNIRPRISQLLVLPPFQKQGLAIHLLNSIYTFYADNKSVIDITVEDPTDNCQAIRDFVDLCRCEKLDCFSEKNLKEGFTTKIEEELRTKLKIHKKQARRLYEILLLRTINKTNEEQYKNYRIQIKNRLNAPFQKMNSTMRRMNHTFKPNEVQEANILQKPEVRFNTLKNLYDELEQHYERVLRRYENQRSTVF